VVDDERDGGGGGQATPVITAPRLRRAALVAGKRAEADVRARTFSASDPSTQAVLSPPRPPPPSSPPALRLHHPRPEPNGAAPRGVVTHITSRHAARQLDECVNSYPAYRRRR
jgi:hypothetical protein